MDLPSSQSTSDSSEPDPNLPSQVDLRHYHQNGFDKGRPGWIILLWWLLQGTLFPLTPHSFHAPRCFLLRLFGAKIGKGVVIRPTARFTYPWKISIGNYSWVGDDVVFYSLDTIEVGEHCVISQKSYLCTGSHDIHDPAFGLKLGAIMIGNGAWIATDCFIAPNIKIGANAVIGARSSVFRSMPAQYICWGSPCMPRTPRQILHQ
ncbi:MULTISPECIES: hormogonium polysaccharide biosynthesis acetyltransferase HpsU [unclassified Leptolyngbya]|uniref:hormogonium polysaccharide biosynthesis acetyltransferase HpsU n=1 Tax=unclassified Leptolyngbya TaxID=2650499 RepID=UPI001688D3AF|nr:MULTISPECIES: hormogonium polysaccharide biosynthesis acetyltransferase HpsU [unclassified Leptolyngbya]MBD1909693.1 colanic acid biosynthesis acetyltransferase WcaF [Leptolyngbya sp. FACHB-8]MBD2155959.1 colanic acid biosynthesis acetyltransferase WcaF [Leptolyngbya sp. FACHB-16]